MGRVLIKGACMKFRRFVPLVALLVLTGCGDPKEYLKEAFTAVVNRPFTSITNVSWSNTKCDSAGSGYRCSLTMTYEVMMGGKRVKDATVEIRQTSDGWRLADEDIFNGGKFTY